MTRRMSIRVRQPAMDRGLVRSELAPVAVATSATVPCVPIPVRAAPSVSPPILVTPMDPAAKKRMVPRAQPTHSVSAATVSKASVARRPAREVVSLVQRRSVPASVWQSLSAAKIRPTFAGTMGPPAAKTMACVTATAVVRSTLREQRARRRSVPATLNNSRQPATASAIARLVRVCPATSTFVIWPVGLAMILVVRMRSALRTQVV